MRKKTRNAVLAFPLCAALAMISPAALADFESGMNYFKSGKYVEAAAEFEAIVAEAPEYDYGYYILGLSYLKMKKPADAATNFQKALDLNDEKFEYYHGLAQAYNSTKNHRKVIETLSGAEELVPDQYRYHFFSMRGLAYASLKRWSESIGDLEKAAALKKSKPITSQIGKAYFQLRHYDKAAAAFRETLKLDPNDLSSQQFLAESLMNLGASERNSTRKKGHYSEALEAAQRYRSKNTNDFNAVNLVGRAALGAQKYDAALLAFDEAIRMRPDYCFAMVNRSKCFIAKEQWTSAEKALKQAAGCAPDMALIHDSLGFVLRKQKRLEDSLNAYEKAYSIKPSDSVQRAIAEVKENISIRDFNEAAAAEEARQKAEAEAARKEQEEHERKLKEWEKKTDDG